MVHALIAVPGAAILLASVLAAPLAVFTSPYGSYNEDWNGMRHVFAEGRLSGLVPFLTYHEETVWMAHGRISDLYPESDSVLLVGPSRVYTKDEARDLRIFLERGGRALLADDRGTGGDLLNDMNVGLSLPKVPILTPGYSRTPDFPIVFSTGALASMPAQVIMERPSVVLGGGNRVLLSPAFSWLDANDNQAPDVDEERASYALAQLVQVGRGELLVVGDASLFTKDLSDANPGVVDAFLGWLVPPGRVLYIDESHRAAADPMGIAPGLAGHAPVWLAVVESLFAIAASLAASYRVRVRRGRAGLRPRFLVAGRAASSAEMAALQELEA